MRMSDNELDGAWRDRERKLAAAQQWRDAVIVSVNEERAVLRARVEASNEEYAKTRAQIEVEYDQRVDEIRKAAHL